MVQSVGLVTGRIHGSVSRTCHRCIHGSVSRTCHRNYTWISHLSQDVYMVQSVGLVTERIHGSVSRTCHRTYTLFSQ